MERVQDRVGVIHRSYFDGKVVPLVQDVTVESCAASMKRD